MLQLKDLQTEVLGYLFGLEQQHLRTAAACTVRARLLHTAGSDPDSAACARCMQFAVDAIMRTCDSYEEESVELCRLAERTPARRVFRKLLLRSAVDMLGPTADQGATQTAASIILTLCSSAAAPGAGGDSLVMDALRAVESLTLSLACKQHDSIACWNVHTMHAPVAASLKAIEELLQSLGKLAGGIMVDRDLIGRAMAI